MSGSNINIKVKTQASQATTALKGLSAGFKGLQREGNNTSKSLSSVVNSLGGIKRIIGSIGIYKFSGALASASKVAMDIRESVHMFNVAMGDMAESTGVAVDKLSELSGMDRTKMLDTVGEYNLLARSMGMAADSAQVLSVNSNKLALDLSALTNREYSKVAEDIRSGLIGQAKTMYKYGVDVTEASIKQEALNQGLTKSVRHMSQSEKMALRYSVMIKQTGLSHGDFTKTIDSGANQLRIFNDRMLTLSRTFGTAFLPILEKVLPYMNALVQAATQLAQEFAKFMGYTGEFEKVVNTPSDFGLGDLSDDAEEVTKKIKELSSQLMGFDEINLYKEPVENPLNELDLGNSSDYNLTGYDNMLDSMSQKSDQIFKRIMAQVDKMRDAFKLLNKAAQPTIKALKKLWDEGLSKLGSFVWQNLKNFYSSFLAPVGKWVLGEQGLPRLFKIFNDMLNNLNYGKVTASLDRLFKAMVPFAKFVLTGMLDFVEYFLIPVGTWVFNTAIEKLANVLSRVLETINWGRINKGLEGFWKALAKLTTLSGDALIWLIENVLEPLAIWGGNVLAIEVIDLFTKSIEVLVDTLGLLKPTWKWFWKDVIGELGKAVGEKVIEMIHKLVDVLDKFSEWANENPDKLNKIAKNVITFGVAFFGLPVAVGASITALSILFNGLKKFVLFKAGETFIDSIDMEGFKEDIDRLWESLKRLGGIGTEAFKWLLDNVIDPIAKWAGESLLPAVFDLVSTALETLADVIEVLKPTWKWLWEDVIKPLGESIGEAFIESLEKIVEGLERLSEWVKENPKQANDIAKDFIKSAGKIATFGAAIMGLKKVGGVAGGLFDKLFKFKQLQGIFKFLNDDLSGTGKMTSALSKATKSIPGDLPLSKDKPVPTAAANAIGMKIVQKPIKATIPSISADDIVEPGIAGKLKGLLAPITGQFSGLSGGITGILGAGAVKIGLILAGIALALYAVYDNWEEIVDLAKTLWDTVLKPVVSAVGDAFIFLWEDAIKPLWDALKPMLMALFKLASSVLGKVIDLLEWLIPILVDRFGPVLKAAAEFIGGVLGPVIETVVGFIKGWLQWLEGVFKVIEGIINLDLGLILEGFGNMWDGVFEQFKAIMFGIPKLIINTIKNAIKLVWEIIKSSGTGLRKNVMEWFENIWQSIKDWIGSWDLSKVIKDKWESAKKAVKDFSMTDYISEKTSGWNPFSKASIPTQTIGLSYAPIPQLAKGGLVDAGQMFIANEAGPEMVGKFGSKTGVVNNEQIVNAISEGVYKAVMSASMGSNKDSNQEAILNIDGRELARIILPHLNGEGKRQGYKPILQY